MYLNFNRVKMFNGYKICEVADVLLYRKSKISRGEQFDDGSKLALIIEGGSIRGIGSSGFAKSLSLSGYTNCFDTIYATSAGALNAVYFVTDDCDTAMSIYYDDATSKNCTNFWNFPDILDVDWLLEAKIFNEKSFDVEYVMNKSKPIIVAVSRASDGKVKYFNLGKLNEIEIENVLKATAYTPLLSSKTSFIQGEYYVDGLIEGALPIDRAISDGCTHAVCLLTHEYGFRKHTGPLLGALERLRLIRRNKAFRNRYMKTNFYYNNSIDIIYGNHNSSIPTLTFNPLKSHKIPRVSGDQALVKKFGENCYTEGMRLLEEMQK